MYNMITCEYCNKEIGKPCFETFGKAYKGVVYREYTDQRHRGLFCNKHCYEEYIKQYQVEVYNGNPIYKIDVNGISRYMPYWGASYYFTTIEDCKKRMDIKNIGIFDFF